MSRTATPRCIWTRRTGDDLKQVRLETVSWFQGSQGGACHVLPEYEQAFRAFDAYATRFSRLFTGLLVLAVCALLGCAVVDSRIGLGVSLAGLGLIFVVFPFTTPETVRLMGVRRSIRLARALGIATVLLGICAAMLLRG